MLIYLSAFWPILLLLVLLALLIFLGCKLHPVRFYRSRRKLCKAADAVLDQTGFAYDPQRRIFVSEPDAWQRRFGYERLYDTMMPFIGVVADVEPVYFDYNGKSWLIQLWKGQYGVTTGFEIGVYNAEPQNAPPETLHYQSVSDAEMPHISFCGFRKGEPYFSRPLRRHWWMTGFRLGDFCRPKKLAMDILLVFDEPEMACAFVCALRRLGYTHLRRQGASVRFLFTRPHSAQPATRNALLDALVLGYDWLMVKLYRTLLGSLRSFSTDRLSKRAWRGCFGWTARCRLK